MSSYKLLYFNFRGAAELSRLVFAAADQEYVDERFSREEWPSVKDEQPMKQVPVLEIDGKKYCQGAAIARYLAREFGLLGSTNLEGLRIEELGEYVSVDLMKDLAKIYFEKDETKKATILKGIAEVTMPKFMDFYNMRLCETDDGNGLFVGKELSLGDLIVYNGLFAVNRFIEKGGQPDIFTKYPKLKAHSERVEAIPRIAEWLKKRPVTDM